MIKRISALMLSLITVSSFAISANAEGDTQQTINNQNKFQVKVDVTSEIIVPTVEVTVPTTASIVLNPYKLTYGDDLSNKQIISTDIEIKNNGTIPVSVNLVKATHTTETTGVDKKTPNLEREIYFRETSTSKDILLYLESDNGKKVNMYGDSTSSYNFGELDAKNSMNLKFTGKMSTGATWTGEESVSITPVFKVNTTATTVE